MSEIPSPACAVSIVNKYASGEASKQILAVVWRGFQAHVVPPELNPKAGEELSLFMGEYVEQQRKWGLKNLGEFVLVRVGVPQIYRRIKRLAETDKFNANKKLLSTYRCTDEDV